MKLLNCEVVLLLIEELAIMQTLFILHLSILMIWYATVLRSESVLDETVLEKDLYSILGLPSGASLQEIKKRFRQLAQQHHPDKAKSNSRHDSTATFQELSEAYDILSNKESRAEYDAHQVRNEQLRKAQERFSAKSGINDMGDRSGFEATIRKCICLKHHNFRMSSTVRCSVPWFVVLKNYW